MSRHIALSGFDSWSGRRVDGFIADNNCTNYGLFLTVPIIAFSNLSIYLQQQNCLLHAL